MVSLTFVYTSLKQPIIEDLYMKEFIGWCLVFTKNGARRAEPGLG